MKDPHLSGSSWDSDVESIALRTQEVAEAMLPGLWLPDNQRSAGQHLNWCTANSVSEDSYRQDHPDTGLTSL